MFTAPLVPILTAEDVPLTVIRRVRKFFIGTIFSSFEREMGEYRATAALNAAVYRDPLSPAPNDEQFKALPFNSLVEHFTAGGAILSQ